MTIADLSDVLKPVAQAKGLPNAHYTSDAVFAAERDAVLFDNWAGLTVGAQIPEPADAVPVEFLGMPLVAIRGRDGMVRVFQNTCRHRGMILVSEKGKVGNVIRCPYHSWSYALSGELKATPHVGGPGHNTHEDIRRDELGLVEIRSHVWMDVVFVNVSGTAPAFEVYAADVMARWAEFDRPLYHGGPESSFAFDVACNWKLAVENYCESYHLPWIHPSWNGFAKLENHYHIENPGRYSGQGSVVDRPDIQAGTQQFPKFQGIDPKWEDTGEYIALYPNVLLGVHRDHVFAIILEPKSTGRTLEHVEIYYADPAVPTAEYQDLRVENARMWHGVFSEDVFVVEGMQKGRDGIYFDGGKFSPAMDGPTHCFHAWVASRLQEVPLAAE